MFKSRHFCVILLIVFIVYWFLIFPLLWVFAKPVIIKNGILDRMNIPPLWISSVFCTGAMIIFIVFLLILWCVICCLRKKLVQIQYNSNLDLVTTGVETYKWRYEDIQDNLIQLDDFKPKYHNATQTTDSTTSSYPTKSVSNDLITSSGRLNSCDRCSKLITDEEVVNILLNKRIIDDNKGNTNSTNAKVEAVGKSVPQAKRNMTHNDDKLHSTNGAPQQLKPKATNTSIPARRNSRLKSEVFIILNNDYSIRDVDGNDDVFK